MDIDALVREIAVLSGKLDAHLENERLVLEKAQVVVTTHGAPELITSLINFVNMLMEREADRKALRKAIIEKTIIGAIWALAIYVGLAVIHELRDVVRDWTMR